MACCCFRFAVFRVMYRLCASLLMTSLCSAMFTSRSREKLVIGISQPIADIAVTDVDRDGNMDMILVSPRGPNVVLTYDPKRDIYTDIALTNPSLASIRDHNGNTVGVCACDIDGDGNEEIYLLNSNRRNFNYKIYKDRLLQWQHNFNRFNDLFNDDINSNLSARHDGHMVNCLDRTGDGRYGVLISDVRETSGSLALLEVKKVQTIFDNSSRIILEDATRAANLARALASRSVTVGPVVGNGGRSDVFLAGYRDDVGRYTKNQLLKNNQRAFQNIALDTGIAGDEENGRAATLADVNNDGIVDVICVNMLSEHRLYIQHVNGTRIQFENEASEHFEEISSARSVLAADFDNDGTLEILLLNAVYKSPFNTGISVRSENALYRVHVTDSGVVLKNISAGDVKISSQHITGASVADMDGDGLLELYITNQDGDRQSLSIYHVTEGKGNNWLRVMPLTRGGAPARGASVKVTLKTDQILLRIIDPTSSLEPVAHFGLGKSQPIEMRVLWPDGHLIKQSLSSYQINVTLKVAYYGRVTSQYGQKPSLPPPQATTVSTSGTNTGFKSSLGFIALALSFRIFI